MGPTRKIGFEPKKNCGTRASGIPFPRQFYGLIVLEMSSKSRTMPGGIADRESLPRGLGDRALCRWCNLEVPPRRFTFCSDWCVHEWRLRTNPGYLREQVYARDRGLCGHCAVDTHAAFIDLKRSRGTHRLKLLAHWGLRSLRRKTLWDADHIVPVVEGGGECDLSNIRTLCVICHRRETQALRQRLRAETPARRLPP